MIGDITKKTCCHIPGTVHLSFLTSDAVQEQPQYHWHTKETLQPQPTKFKETKLKIFSQLGCIFSISNTQEGYWQDVFFFNNMFIFV